MEVRDLRGLVILEGRRRPPGVVLPGVEGSAGGAGGVGGGGGTAASAMLTKLTVWCGCFGICDL